MKSLLSNYLLSSRRSSIHRIDETVTAAAPTAATTTTTTNLDPIVEPSVGKKELLTTENVGKDTTVLITASSSKINDQISLKYIDDNESDTASASANNALALSRPGTPRMDPVHSHKCKLYEVLIYNVWFV